MKVKQTNMEEDLLSGILLLRNIQVCVCVRVFINLSEEDYD